MKSFKYLLLVFVMLFVGVFSVSAQTEDEKLWEDFVEAFKNTEIVASMNGADSIDFNHDADSLEIVVKDEGKTYTTIFQYADGILTYVPLAGATPEESLENSVADTVWIMNTIFALRDLKGYNSDKFDEWTSGLPEDKVFSLAEDGLEYTEETYEKTGSDENGEYSFTIDYYTSCKLDIKNGLKAFEKYLADQKNNTNTTVNTTKKEEIKNPSTGDNLMSSVVIGVLSLSSILGIALVSRKKLS